MVTIERYDADAAEWDAYVATHPAATNYHRYGWRSVIEESFGHPTHYFAARGRGGGLRGILPLVHMKSRLFGNFLVSLPFFNYGGLLCAEDAANPLLEVARDMMREVGGSHVELRHYLLPCAGLPRKSHKVTMLLPLKESADAQWSCLDPKVRNQVRKAQKSGLTTVFGGGELLDGFYRVFCRNMRDLGTPVYGREFFRSVLERFSESSRIVSVLREGEAVASGILTWHRDTVEVPWASSLRECRELCPNNLLYWEAISFAIRNGASSFDFGRSTPGEGTFRFKKQWGAKPHELHWDYLLAAGTPLPELNPANPKYRLAIWAWQRLPLALTNVLGPAIVRNIP